MKHINSLESLSKVIEETNQFFRNRVQKHVNVSLTLRNWIIGCHIIEYEQLGKDRAKYGKKVLESLASRLKEKGVKGLAETNLKFFGQFYNTYPQIRQTLPDELKFIDLQLIKIGQAVPDQSRREEVKANTVSLINNLSFSHFIELLKADSELKRRFYEAQSIKNNWGVRDLLLGNIGYNRNFFVPVYFLI
jgi:hypothetical protein